MAFLSDVVRLVAAYWLPLAVAGLVLRLGWNRYGKGLSGIPGPFLASLSDVWLFVHYWRRRTLQEYDMHQAYKSPLLRLGPRLVSVADVEAYKVIYGWKPLFQKSENYKAWMVAAADGTVVLNTVSSRSEEEHRTLRRPVAHTYSLSAVLEHEPLVDSTTLEFLRQMDAFAASGQECPYHRWLQMYAFDVVGEITFGNRLGFLETGKDVGNMMYHTAWSIEYGGLMMAVPTVDEYMRVKGFGYILRRFRKTNALMKFTAAHIREHEEERDEQRQKQRQKDVDEGEDSSTARRPVDFLTRFMAARDKYPDLVTPQRVAVYANTNVAAGSDTTAVVLREVVYRLLTHAGARQKLEAEVEAVVRARIEASNPAASSEEQEALLEKPISWAEAQTLTYYQALVKECLRLHPPSGLMLPREVPAGGVSLCGTFLPAGTVVGCNAWTLHRDRAVYGADADVFRPERWLEPGGATHLESLSFTFGAGSRVCLGRNVAMLEISKLVPELFRRFDVRIVDPARYIRRPGFLVQQTGLDVVLKRKQTALGSQ